jgi:hypothetical protein
LPRFASGRPAAKGLSERSLESLQTISATIFGKRECRKPAGSSGAQHCISTEMTSETAQKARDCTVDPVVLKLEEFLPYRLNVCASLISHALSRIYAERYKIGNPEWRVLVTLGQFGTMTAKASALVATCARQKYRAPSPCWKGVN